MPSAGSVDPGASPIIELVFAGLNFLGRPVGVKLAFPSASEICATFPVPMKTFALDICPLPSDLGEESSSRTRIMFRLLTRPTTTIYGENFTTLK